MILLQSNTLIFVCLNTENHCFLAAGDPFVDRCAVHSKRKTNILNEATFAYKNLIRYFDSTVQIRERLLSLDPEKNNVTCFYNMSKFIVSDSRGRWLIYYLIYSYSLRTMH